MADVRSDEVFVTIPGETLLCVVAVSMGEIAVREEPD